MKLLQGQVAVVAGATRGAGRGIAVELGAAGATVYCTGRSTRGNPSPMNRPETIEETAERVTAAGGNGIPVRVDHMVPDEVAALFECIQSEQNGRLDLLVNDIWGGESLIEWAPFWELSLDKGLRMLPQAIHSHIITACFGAPLMLKNGRGLIIEVTDGDSDTYRGALFYDLVKTSIIRMARAMAHDLREHKHTGITALALTPGFLRSEEMLDHFGVTEPKWRDAIEKNADFAVSETPHYIGRAVVALASDPEVSKKAGQALSTWGLMREYGFKDIDGSQPDWGAHFEATYGNSS